MQINFVLLNEHHGISIAKSNNMHELKFFREIYSFNSQGVVCRQILENKHLNLEKFWFPFESLSSCHKIGETRFHHGRIAKSARIVQFNRERRKNYHEINFSKSIVSHSWISDSSTSSVAFITQTEILFKIFRKKIRINKFALQQLCRLHTGRSINTHLQIRLVLFLIQFNILW